MLQSRWEEGGEGNSAHPFFIYWVDLKQHRERKGRTEFLSSSHSSPSSIFRTEDGEKKKGGVQP